MRVLLAGATGAIGQSLVRHLRAAGVSVVGMVRSAEAGSALVAAGAESVMADALDAQSVRDALMEARPDAVINELTALPSHYTPEEMKAAAARDREVRLTGNANLLAAMEAAGVRRYLLQSSAFWYAGGEGLASEEAQFALDASPGIAAGTRTYAELESKAFGTPNLKVVALRYGFFYGPGTWYIREGDIGDQVRQRGLPIIGDGQGVWSFVHIEDAAAATVAALDAAPGAYNIVDNDPSQQRAWLPAFARYAGAPAPPQVTEDEALVSAGRGRRVLCNAPPRRLERESQARVELSAAQVGMVERLA